jgi:hypothetical protein
VKQCKKLDNTEIDMLCQLFLVKIGCLGTAEAQTIDVHVDKALACHQP